jgi:hypothetical protein
MMISKSLKSRTVRFLFRAVLFCLVVSVNLSLNTACTKTPVRKHNKLKRGKPIPCPVKDC